MLPKRIEVEQSATPREKAKKEAGQAQQEVQETCARVEMSTKIGDGDKVPNARVEMSTKIGDGDKVPNARVEMSTKIGDARVEMSTKIGRLVKASNLVRSM